MPKKDILVPARASVAPRPALAPLLPAQRVCLGLVLGLWAVAVGTKPVIAQQGASHVPPSAEAQGRFRASVTATVMLAGRTADSTPPGCESIAIEWRSLPGSARYEVQVSVGASRPTTWVEAKPDVRCGETTGKSASTSFRDRVVRPGGRRFYRVVAVDSAGRPLAVSAPVPVDLR